MTLCVHADIDECANDNNCTEEKNQICSDTIGSYQCDCQPGFTQNTAEADDSCQGKSIMYAYYQDNNYYVT